MLREYERRLVFRLGRLAAQKGPGLVSEEELRGFRI